MIVKVENNQIVKRNVFLAKEFPYTSFPEPLTQDALPDGYFIMLPPDQVELNWDEKIIEVEPVFVNGIPKISHQVVKKTSQEITEIIKNKKDQLKNTVANKRSQLENKGIEFLNLKFRTDQTSQIKLLSVYVFATQDVNYSVNWKTENGVFINLSSVQIIELVRNVRNYIQSCFDWESAINLTINAENEYEKLIELQEEINITNNI